MKVTKDDLFPMPRKRVGEYEYESFTHDAFYDGAPCVRQFWDKAEDAIGFWSIDSVVKSAGEKNLRSFVDINNHDLSALSLKRRFAIKLGFAANAKAYLRHLEYKDNQIPMVILLSFEGEVQPKRRRELSSYCPDAFLVFADMTEIRKYIIASMCATVSMNSYKPEYFDEDIAQAVEAGKYAYGGNNVSSMGLSFQETQQRIVNAAFHYNTQFLYEGDKWNKFVGNFRQYIYLAAGKESTVKPPPQTKELRKRETMIHSMIDKLLEEQQVVQLSSLREALQRKPFGMMFTNLDIYLLAKVIHSYERKAVYVDACCISRKKNFTEIVMSNIIMQNRFQKDAVIVDLNKYLTSYLNIGNKLYKSTSGFYQSEFSHSISNVTNYVTRWAERNQIFIFYLPAYFQKIGETVYAEASEAINALSKHCNTSVDAVKNIIKAAETIGRCFKNADEFLIYLQACEGVREDPAHMDYIKMVGNNGASAMWWLWGKEMIENRRRTDE